jgi:hypothetical protein
MAAGGLVLASVLILDPRMCCCLHCFLSQGHYSCLALRFSPPKTKQNTIYYFQDHHIFFIELLVWFLTLRVNAPENKAFSFLFFFFLALKTVHAFVNIFLCVLTKINNELYRVINNNKFVYFNSKLSWEVKINIFFI